MTDRNYGEHGRCEATAKSTGERCKKSAIGPHGKCDSHGGKSKKGADHPNYKHGAFSKYFRSDLSEREEDALADMLDAVDDPEQIKDVLAEVAFEHLVKGKRSGDPRFTREARQLLAEFNIVDNTDQLEVDANVDADHSLDEGTKDIMREVLRRRREDGDSE
ncbi:MULTISPECIES: hypothetical protein [Halorussus]|uniref:hypothetical protein n=1 Tax=Halorussus TaxID=1070314 RepID=UPI0020A12741|nr:hypothetical protein [Halorussus vallis]USZ75652.1 hypothetical protein NGM07_19765 [Halorussus vallis]USZ75706.1 hypothetical protein NGM07_20040 [Halorussus vallis]